MTIEQQRDQWVRKELVRCNNCEGDTSLDIRGAWDAGFLAGAQSGWVKVTPETMPEPGNSVIVAYQFGVGECRFYTGKFINLVMDCEMPGVTHWMPLPSKPII